MHGVPSNGLVLTERAPGGRKIVSVSDTRMFEGLVQHCRDADRVVCESTMPGRFARLGRAFQHMTAAQAADVARRAHASRLVLTHVSRFARASTFEREARAVFSNTVVAEDYSVFGVRDRHLK